MFAKKKTLGFEKKLRTKEDIELDYQTQAFNLGHKALLAHQLEKRLESLHKGIEDHLDELQLLAEEKFKLPPDAPIPQAKRVDG